MLVFPSFHIVVLLSPKSLILEIICLKIHEAKKKDRQTLRGIDSAIASQSYIDVTRSFKSFGNKLSRFKSCQH